MTNADKIRSMTDEELTELFIRIGEGNTPVSLVINKNDRDLYLEYVWLNWLKQEVTDND